MAGKSEIPPSPRRPETTSEMIKRALRNTKMLMIFAFQRSKSRPRDVKTVKIIADFTFQGPKKATISPISVKRAPPECPIVYRKRRERSASFPDRGLGNPRNIEFFTPFFHFFEWKMIKKLDFFKPISWKSILISSKFEKTLPFLRKNVHSLSQFRGKS